MNATSSLFNIERYQQYNANVNSAIDFTHDFDLILTRGNVKHIKPHPEIYLTAMQHFQLQPEECLIVEDSLIGIEAAVFAGIDAVAIYDEYSAAEQEQIQSKARFYVQNFIEFSNLAKLGPPT